MQTSLANLIQMDQVNLLRGKASGALTAQC